MTLSAKNCAQCKDGDAPLSRTEASAMLKEVPGWELTSDGKWLVRNFKFRNFKEAITFADRVGEICEEQGHHADFALGWGYCNLRLQTHSVGGVHENDFILAARVNAIG